MLAYSKRHEQVRRGKKFPSLQCWWMLPLFAGCGGALKWWCNGAKKYVGVTDG